MARVSIEDCQKKLANRFALAMTAAHRARQLLGDAKPLVESHNKEAVTALREIAEGYITMQTPEQRESLLAAESAANTENETATQEKETPTEKETKTDTQDDIQEQPTLEQEAVSLQT
ncbi:MAG: DNA-directed RNA polymerase subunit omega [Proteobacteria bacterium]|nr:DNA-directed RNA polymerase subunit omega [Pseudomonadota bacterium]